MDLLLDLQHRRRRRRVSAAPIDWSSNNVRLFARAYGDQSRFRGGGLISLRENVESQGRVEGGYEEDQDGQLRAFQVRRFLSR